MPATTSTRKAPTACLDNLNPDGSLRLQIGVRVRLDDTQRSQLKTAYDNLLNSYSKPTGHVFGDVNVNTSVTVRDATNLLGMDRTTFSSLVASRESLPVGIALRFQKHLGVELVPEKLLATAFADYKRHIFEANA